MFFFKIKMDKFLYYSVKKDIEHLAVVAVMPSIESYLRIALL